jgi:large subunit ribosomal protein L22
MDPEKLYVSTCFVAPGPIMKRIRFVSRAGVHRIEKRTSHITVAVSER